MPANTLINLLPSRSKFNLKLLKISQTVKRVSYTVLVVFITIASLMLAANFLFIQGASRATARLQASRVEFSQYLPQVDEGQNIRFRIKLVSQILKSRPLISSKLVKIYELLGDQATINRFKSDDKGAEVYGTISGYRQLQDLENRINASRSENEKEYGKMLLTSLGQDKFGSWAFVLKIEGVKTN